MNIRRAEPGDFAWIASQLRDFARSLDTVHSYIPATEEALLEEVRAMAHRHVLLVAQASDGSLAGTIGGLLAPHPYNPAICVLQERFWWVPVSHRGSRAGYMLLREFLNHGALLANVTTLSLEDNSPVSDNVLNRLGLRLLERIYVAEA